MARLPRYKYIDAPDWKIEFQRILRQRRIDDAEEYREYRRAWYAATQGKAREYHRRWREKLRQNPERYEAYLERERARGKAARARKRAGLEGK